MTPNSVDYSVSFLQNCEPVCLMDNTSHQLLICFILCWPVQAVNKPWLTVCLCSLLCIKAQLMLHGRAVPQQIDINVWML